MKIIASAVTAAALIYLVACDKPQSAKETPAPAPEIAQATPAPEKKPEPAPAPVVEEPIAQAAPAAPDPKQFAPAGVFFLVTAASVETDSGIVGLKPGQRLQQTAPGQYTADGNQLTLRDDQVTNDLRVAARASGMNAASEAALRQSLAAGAAAEHARLSAANAAPAPVVPPGSRVYTTTTTSSGGAGGSTTRVSSFTVTSSPASPAKVAPAAPASSLDKGAYNEKKGVAKPAEYRRMYR
ncbi:MAG TPA: hypothetical protein VF614_00585 [Chthoniobacteraceae bacterium]|jgi:hypothetical protein